MTARHRPATRPSPSLGAPIVLYHGKAQWTAEEDMAGLCVAPARTSPSTSPRNRYFLLDVAAYTDPLPEGHNLMAALIHIVHCRSVETVSRRY